MQVNIFIYLIYLITLALFVPVENEKCSCPTVRKYYRKIMVFVNCTISLEVVVSMVSGNNRLVKSGKGNGLNTCGGRDLTDNWSKRKVCGVSGKFFMLKLFLTCQNFDLHPQADGHLIPEAVECQGLLPR